MSKTGPLPRMKIANGSSDSYKTLPEYLTAEILWKVFPICLIILGTIGNSLCILVLMKKGNRQLRGSIYLIVLAFADETVLYSGLMREWILHTFNLDLRESSDGICKLNLFFTYFSVGLSTWLLLAITFDRVVVIFFPFCVKKRYAKFSPVVVILCIVVFTFALNAHLLWGNGTTVISRGNITQTITCGYKSENYKMFVHEANKWINFVLHFILPYVALSLGNILIILKMKSLKKKVQPNLRKDCNKITSMTEEGKATSLSEKLKPVCTKNGVKESITCEDNGFKPNGKACNISEKERENKVMFIPKKDSKYSEKLKDNLELEGTSAVIFRHETKDGEIKKDIFETEGTSKENKSNIIIKLEKGLPKKEDTSDESTDKVLIKLENDLQNCLDFNNSPGIVGNNKALSGKGTHLHVHSKNSTTMKETGNVPQQLGLRKVMRLSRNTETNNASPRSGINNETTTTIVDNEETNTVLRRVDEENEDICDNNDQSLSEAENDERKQTEKTTAVEEEINMMLPEVKEKNGDTSDKNDQSFSGEENRKGIRIETIYDVRVSPEVSQKNADTTNKNAQLFTETDKRGRKLVETTFPVKASPKVSGKNAETSDKNVQTLSEADNRVQKDPRSSTSMNMQGDHQKDKNKKATDFFLSFKRLKLNRKPSSHSIVVSKNDKVNTLTRTLLMLNTVFLVCNAPIGIFQVSRSRLYQNATQQEIAELTLWWAFVNMFMYFNYTFNFLFCCLSGTKFREDVKTMFSRCKKH